MMTKTKPMTGKNQELIQKQGDGGEAGAEGQ